MLSQSYYRILRLANNLSDAAGLEREMRPIPLQNDDVVVLVRNVVRQAEVPAELLDLTLSFHSEKPGHVAAVEPARRGGRPVRPDTSPGCTGWAGTRSPWCPAPARR